MKKPDCCPVNMLNEKTRYLLNSLYRNSLASQDDLARQLEAMNLPASRQNIGKYIDYIEKGNFISYTIVENPNVHEVRTFFIEIKTNPEEPEIVTKLSDMPRVRSIDGIIGQNSLVVKVCTRNDQQFAAILKQLDGIITGTRFQHYKVINCLKTFKDGGETLLPLNIDDSIAMDEIPELDSIDEYLLDTMQNTGATLAELPERMSYGWIVEHVHVPGQGLTYSQVRRRVNAMVESRLIHAFTIKIAPGFIPQTDVPLKFYLQILPKRLSEYDAIAIETLAIKGEIVELYRTGEEYGLFAIARTSSIAGYRQFLESLYKTGKIQDTISTLVIDEKLPAIFKPFNDPPSSHRPIATLDKG
jgi:DNA-binding Lrp family transcriptional regulator